ncbi:MAG: zinc ribbon domain-containing protein [Actinomycetia bacterium]|nr:zinc ribbon domain-containing protein [Actinomycetes bacterium]
MGILDNIQSGLNRGVDSAGRATRKIQLNARLKEVDRRRDELLAQLGASLFQEARNTPALYDPRESLFRSIDEQDSERNTLLAEIDSIDKQTQASTMAKTMTTCPSCGKSVSVGDAFCTGCGFKLDDGSADSSDSAAPQRFCISCGTPMVPDMKFCMNCGTQQPEEVCAVTAPI